MLQHIKEWHHQKKFRKWVNAIDLNAKTLQHVLDGMALIDPKWVSGLNLLRCQGIYLPSGTIRLYDLIHGLAGITEAIPKRSSIPHIEKGIVEDPVRLDNWWYHEEVDSIATGITTLLRLLYLVDSQVCDEYPITFINRRLSNCIQTMYFLIETLGNEYYEQKE